MRKHTIASAVCVGLFLSLPVLFMANRQTQALQDGGGAPPQALVLSDLGSYQNIVASMAGVGWAVTTADTMEVELLEVDGALGAYDVVWVPAETNDPALKLLVEDGGALESFARQGGVLVIWGLRPDTGTLWLDIAPGGADAAPLPAGGAGPVAVTDDHPRFLSGLLLVEDGLDPYSIGGGGCVVNTPAECPTVVLAENAAGPVLLHYRYRLGHVVVGALFNETAACREEVLRGLETISQ